MELNIKLASLRTHAKIEQIVINTKIDMGLPVNDRDLNEIESLENQIRTTQEFIENPIQTIRDMIKKMADSSGHACGLSYELYAARLSSGFDRLVSCGTIPQQYVGEATKIAVEYGYATPEKIEQMFDGLCAHGLEPDYCPLGCGEYD